MQEVGAPSNKKSTKPAIMETYGDDMVSVISKDTSGLVQRIIHEQEEREKEKINSSPYSKQNRFFLFISLFFLMAALGLVGYYYFFYDKNEGYVDSVTFKSLIVNDNTIFLEIAGLDKEGIGNKVAAQKDLTKIKKEQLEAIYLTENNNVVSWSRLNTITKSSFPQSRSPIVNENFMIGLTSFEIQEPPKPEPTQTTTENTEDSLIVAGDLLESEDLGVVPIFEDPLRVAPDKPTRKDLFILLSVKSFADVFPVIRAWEVKMLEDLSFTLGIDVKGDKRYLLTKDWEDGIVQNKNARMLYDKDGNLVLMYVFSDENHIIIAKTEDSVREVIERLVASKVRK